MVVGENLYGLWRNLVCFHWRKSVCFILPFTADDIEWLKKEAETIEMPNIAEGYSKIYVVVDGKVEERIETLDEELISRAKSELEDEEKKEKEAEEKTRKHEEFLNELEKKGFWHYCEVCGKKEFLTPEEAYSQGWDYPPKMGFYGVISPRKCGSCGIEKTLYWKIVLEKKKMEDLTEEEEKTLARIVMEPQSLLKEEKSGKK